MIASWLFVECVFPWATVVRSRRGSNYSYCRRKSFRTCGWKEGPGSCRFSRLPACLRVGSSCSRVCPVQPAHAGSDGVGWWDARAREP